MDRFGAGCAAAVLVAASAQAAAQTRHHQTHEHGVGRLELAQQSAQLSARLALPAVDVVGFEQGTHTAAQRQRLQRAVAVLEEDHELLSPAAPARCRLASTRLHSALLEQTAGRDRDDHEHEHQHEHGDHHDRADHGPGEAGHAEFVVHYQWHCDQPAELASVSTRVFEHWPSIGSIRVLYATDAGQGAATLVPGRATLRLAP